MSHPLIRLATPSDLPRLHAVIERAYRGEAARAGWTHEGDLLEGARPTSPRSKRSSRTPMHGCLLR
ncbi:MAG: hypothetical protein ABI471_06225 [Sphingomonas bacterium]